MLHATGGYFQGIGTSVLRAPDLYDEQAVQAGANSSIYIGSWDIMSSSTGGMTAWTRMKMGWLGQDKVLTLTSWSDSIINITSLDVPAHSMQTIKIPIQAKIVTLSNGTKVDDSAYYLVEYRTPAGIDSALKHPTVLITRANDTRYLERQSGPLILGGALTFSSSSHKLPRYFIQPYDHDTLRYEIGSDVAPQNTASVYIDN